uniref:Putative ovule protein n=1 Tax=Solanum chacoense TaxID=4108 RepID=A0A0V0HVE5_SOLCH
MREHKRAYVITCPEFCCKQLSISIGYLKRMTFSVANQLYYMSHGRENLNSGETIYRINRMNSAKLLLLTLVRYKLFIIFFQNYERPRKIRFFYK